MIIQYLELHPLLSPYIKSIEIITQHLLCPYRIYPSLFPVIGFQFEGKLALLNEGDKSEELKRSGITGLLTNHRDFKALQPSTKSVLIKMYPWGVPKFFKEAANVVSNQSIGLTDIVCRERISILEERIQLNKSPLALINLIQEFFVELYLANNSKYEPKPRIINIAQEIARNPKRTIEEIGKTYGYSKRSLERHFLTTVGLSPKKFMLSARFQQTLKMLQKGACWSVIANDFNYCDQSHFIKEFQAFTGTTPQQFILNNQ